MKSTNQYAPNISWIYPHHIFAALRDMNVTYYTSPIDYITVQYNGGWMPYEKFRKVFKHLPKVNLDSLVTKV